MKIISKKEAPFSKRSDGRIVTTLFDLQLDSPQTSMVFYHCDVPNGNFGKHYHAKSTELIFFPMGGKMEINGTEYSFNSWDGVLLEAGDIHGYVGDECSDIIHFAVRIPSANDKIEVD